MNAPTDPMILIVEDEPSQVALLSYNLKKSGFAVASASSGEEALLCVEEISPDLILLDWMLPHLSGIETCRRIKRSKSHADTPIVMLTARGEEEDRIRGLDIGADDYVVKPYSIKELLARIRAVIRRSRAAIAHEVLTFKHIRLDQRRHCVLIDGSMVEMGPTEFRLLLTLMEAPERVWTRETLLERVWGRNTDIETRTVDVHIGRLRKLLRIDGQDPIRTVRGFGYGLNLDFQYSSDT